MHSRSSTSSLSRKTLMSRPSNGFLCIWRTHVSMSLALVNSAYPKPALRPSPSSTTLTNLTSPTTSLILSEAGNYYCALFILSYLLVSSISRWKEDFLWLLEICAGHDHHVKASIDPSVWWKVLKSQHYVICESQIKDMEEKIDKIQNFETDWI